MNLEIFDPLDREIRGSGEEDLAIKRADLKSQMTSMEGILASTLQVCMSNKLQTTLDSLFKVE